MGKVFRVCRRSLRTFWMTVNELGRRLLRTCIRKLFGYWGIWGQRFQPPDGFYPLLGGENF